MSSGAIDLGKSMLMAGSLNLWEIVRCCIAGLVLKWYSAMAASSSSERWSIDLRVECFDKCK